MADFFDALAARALGTASALVPTPVPRFAAPVQDQLHDGPALDPDGSTPAPEPGPRPGAAAGTPAALSPVSPSRAPDEPRNAELRGAGPRPEVLEPGHEAEALGGVARARRPDGSAPEVVSADSDSPARRPPGRVVGDPEMSTEALTGLGLRTAEPSTRRLRAAAPREPTRDPGTDALLRPPLGSDDRSPPAASGSPPAQVTVSIGYVEVRAPTKTPEPPSAALRRPRPEPRLSLQDYLRRDGRR